MLPGPPVELAPEADPSTVRVQAMPGGGYAVRWAEPYDGISGPRHLHLVRAAVRRPRRHGFEAEAEADRRLGRTRRSPGGPDGAERRFELEATDFRQRQDQLVVRARKRVGERDLVDDEPGAAATQVDDLRRARVAATVEDRAADRRIDRELRAEPLATLQARDRRRKVDDGRGTVAQRDERRGPRLECDLDVVELADERQSIRSACTGSTLSARRAGT